MPMQILYIILLLTVALLFAIEDASGEGIYNHCLSY